VSPENSGPIFPVEKRGRRMSSSAAMGGVLAWIVPIGVAAVVGFGAWKLGAHHFGGPSVEVLVNKEVTLQPGAHETGSFGLTRYANWRFIVTPKTGTVGMTCRRIKREKPSAAEMETMRNQLSSVPAGDPYKIAGQGETGEHLAWLVVNPSDKPATVVIEVRLQRE